MLCAKNEKTARWTVLGALILLAVLYFTLVHIGLGMRFGTYAAYVKSSDE